MKDDLQELIDMFDEMFENAGNDDEEADDYLNNIITLTSDDGEEIDFEFLDVIEYYGEDYAVLLPLADDDSEVVILRLEQKDEDTINYFSVEDEGILSAVFEIFKEKFKDVFNFED